MHCPDADTPTCAANGGPCCDCEPGPCADRITAASAASAAAPQDPAARVWTPEDLPSAPAAPACRTLDEFQMEALETADQSRRGSFPWLMYLGLGLTGEAGEVTDHIKKAFRDDDMEVTPARRAAMKAELGDVLWYVATIAAELGFTLSSVAAANTDKLRSRARRGRIGGSGDER